MSSIFYQLYQPSGLFNQITSIELAVGLASRYKKQLIIYNLSNGPDPSYGGKRVPIYSANYFYNNRTNLIDSGIFPNITDLVDWENKECNILIDDIINSFTKEDLRIDNLMEYYSSSSPEFLNNEDLFAETRKKLFIEDEINVHLKKTLGYYSRFFFNRNSSLDKSLSSVKFKSEYYELAGKIANSIGKFDGVHFRITDNKSMFTPSVEILDSGVSKINSGLPIVMCTDNSNSKIIEQSSYDYIHLDKYILDNFYHDFKQFKFKEEVSFGILNNLVMHNSNNFIGTPGSTFTGYIHRSINQKGDAGLHLFGEDPIVQSGPYSWNGYEHQDSLTKQWWREWKESKLDI